MTRYTDAEIAEHLLDSYTDVSKNDCVRRWHSNNRCVPSDIMTALFNAGRVTEQIMLATRETEDKETAALLRRYVASRGARTKEQIEEENFEIRAAFGPGVKVVNVITGETVRT